MKLKLFLTLTAALACTVSYGQDFVWHDISGKVASTNLSCLEFTSNSSEIYVRYTFPKKHEHESGTYREPSIIDLMRINNDGSISEVNGIRCEIHEGHFIRAFRDIKYENRKDGSRFRVYLPLGMVWKDCEIGIRPDSVIAFDGEGDAEHIVVYDTMPFTGNTSSFWTSKIQMMFGCPMKVFTREEDKEKLFEEPATLYIVTDEATADEFRQKTEKPVLVYRAK